MSFVKIPRKYPSKPQHSKKKKQNPEWDDTINDLSVHKATQDELSRRRQVATSNNLDLVKDDQLQSKLRKARKKSSQSQRKTALLKEVLYDNSQLHEALSKSDKMMSVVRDLFGDDPAKYKGLPHVTTAPQILSLNSSDLPEGSIIEEPSKLDVLSEAIMNKSALNELDSDCQSLDSDDVDLNYKPALDFGRFQQLLAKAEQADKDMERDRQTGKEVTGRWGQNMTDRVLEQFATKLIDNHDDEDADTPVSGAINDTQKIERSRSRLTREEQDTVRSETNEEFTSLDSLRKVLDGLETNIADFEKMTGREPAYREPGGNPSLTGFTERLVSAVNKVSKYLKENELRLRVETTLREQLHQNLTHTRSLVDTLTNDVIATQEQYIGLQSEFVNYKKDSSKQIQAIQQVLEAHGLQIQPVQVPTSAHPIPQQRVQSGAPAEQHQSFQSDLTNSSTAGRLQTSVPQFVTAAGQQYHSQSISNLPVVPAANQAAVSLGMPQQKDSPKAPGKQRSRLEPSENGHSFQQNEASLQSYTQYPPQPSKLPPQTLDFITQQNINSQQARDSTTPNSNSTISSYRQFLGHETLERNVPAENTNEGRNFTSQASTAMTQQQRGEVNPVVLRQQIGDIQISQYPPTQQQIPQYTQQQQRPHLVNEAHTTMPGSAPMQAVQGQNGGGMKVRDGPTEMSENLERQIEELNRQHAEAQSKLVQLMEQQQTVDKQFPGQIGPVSPPISPITVDSDTENRPPLSHAMHKPKPLQKLAKEIKIALPRVENIIELQNHRI